MWIKVSALLLSMICSLNRYIWFFRNHHTLYADARWRRCDLFVYFIYLYIFVDHNIAVCGANTWTYIGNVYRAFWNINILYNPHLIPIDGRLEPVGKMYDYHIESPYLVVYWIHEGMKYFRSSWVNIVGISTSWLQNPYFHRVNKQMNQWTNICICYIYIYDICNTYINIYIYIYNTVFWRPIYMHV